ncbi:MAG: hypothetical protein SGCHY_001326 [Lobulomycetales sp.]
MYNQPRYSGESARGGLEFQSFSYGNPLQQQQHSLQPQGTASYSQPVPPPMAQPVSWTSIREAFSSTAQGYDDPPLLEDKHIMDDTDLAGPIVFALLFAAFLQIGGSNSVNFGYVYGISVFGVVAIYGILNLMSDNGIDVWKTASVLGYCLLPMIIVSFLSSIVNLSGTGDLILTLLSFISVFWCTYSSSGIFVTVLQMSSQRFLVAYPIGLLYTAFAILALYGGNGSGGASSLKGLPKAGG